MAASITLQAARSQAHKLPLALQDRERKHAADRELWRRQMAEAVQQVWCWWARLGDVTLAWQLPKKGSNGKAAPESVVRVRMPGSCACVCATVCSVLLTSDTHAPVSDQAREEMAALTDLRLDATTRRTLIENEEMAGEAQTSSFSMSMNGCAAPWCWVQGQRHELCSTAPRAPCPVHLLPHSTLSHPTLSPFNLAPFNPALLGELQYQGRHVPALLARNSALQKEVGCGSGAWVAAVDLAQCRPLLVEWASAASQPKLRAALLWPPPWHHPTTHAMPAAPCLHAQVAELRVQLSIGRRNEEELAKKVLASERAAESLVRQRALRSCWNAAYPTCSCCCMHCWRIACRRDRCGAGAGALNHRWHAWRRSRRNEQPARRWRGAWQPSWRRLGCAGECGHGAA